MPSKKEKMPDQYTVKRLQCWFRSLFEKYGWMILSLNYKGNKVKIDNYKESLKRLSSAFGEKIKNVTDADVKQDLEIMAEHVSVLIKHAEKHLVY